jgi:hypothetical protein
VTTAGNGSPSGYAWTQISGPGTATLTNANSATLGVTASVPGAYVFRLTVTDSAGGTSHTDQEVGIVTTDAHGVISSGSSDLDKLLGPLTTHGVNPWPWYDVTEAADADALAPYMAAPMIGGSTPLTGTVSIKLAAPNSGYDGQVCCNPTVVGVGTHFLTDLRGGDLIYLWWDRDGDGSNKGRALMGVGAVTDDTHFTILDYYWTHPLAMSATMNISKAGVDVAMYTATGEPGTSWGYYDAGLGISRLYRRTNLSAYQTESRAFCDNWFTYGLDSGYRSTKPRNSAWKSMMACAADNHPEW